MSNLTIPVLIALVTITPLALAGETTIDLQGGGLFVVPARDPGDTSPRTFEYVVDASDTLRFINGTMIEYTPVTTLGDIPQDWFRLQVDGTMIFGANFPEQPTILDFYNWLPTEINGSVIFDKPTTIDYSHPIAPWTVAEGADLSVTDGNVVDLAIVLTNDGEVSVGNNARLFMTHVGGGGTINLAASARLGAELYNQTINVGPGAHLDVLGNNYYMLKGSIYQSTINLPADGGVVLRYGSKSTGIRESTVVIADVPAATPSMFTRITDPVKFPFSPIIQSTIRLTEASGVDAGDAELILECENCDPMGNALSTVSLEAPIDNSGPSYVLRWGTDGLYVLGTPADWCPADMNLDGTLNVFDFMTYISYYNDGSPWANTTQTDQTINFFDIQTFVDIYNAGCP